MTNGNQSTHRARSAMGSLKNLFGRKPAKPADHYQSWITPGQPTATEPVGKDGTYAVDR
jgi:hypothetical protein